MKALSVLALAGSVAAAAATSPGDDLSYRLYLASTAAAEAALRLHETAAAQRWLDEAPAAHRGWEWRHLDALADRSSGRAVVGARVLDVALSPDGRWLATAAADGALKLWNTATLAAVRSLAGPTRAVWVVAFSPDGESPATASSDGTARVWDVASAREVSVSKA